MTSSVDSYVTICFYDDLIPGRGVAALVDGRQIALFRLYDGSVYAVSNLDPFSGAYVLARGLVGTHQGTPTVASPMYKQRFDLRTGRCLDTDEVSITVYPVRVHDGQIEISVEAARNVA